MNKISKTQLSKILNDCKFNPRESGPFKIIADVGNTDYYKTRAIEFITCADGSCDSKESLQSAIALLALALANETS